MTGQWPFIKSPRGKIESEVDNGENCGMSGPLPIEIAIPLAPARARKYEVHNHIWSVSFPFQCSGCESVTFRLNVQLESNYSQQG